VGADVQGLLQRQLHVAHERLQLDANLSILRRTALSLLKNEKTAKIGVKNKRLNAGWDEDYLAKVVFGT
jgi:hypothetical protein